METQKKVPSNEGVALIMQERIHQIVDLQLSTASDNYYNKDGQLVTAAVRLMEHTEEMSFEHAPPLGWNTEAWSKLIKKPYKQRLIIAGALIAAEIDRLNYEEYKILGSNQDS